jgi:hypothetical protein
MGTLRIASWVVSPSSGPVCARPKLPWRNGRASWSLGGPSMRACATMAKVDQQPALAVVVAAADGAEYAPCGAVDGSNGAEGE